MKKFLGIFLAAILCVMMAVAVNAADLYVNDEGTGDGSSPENPLGTLEEAYFYLADQGGTIHIVDTITVKGAFTEPEHSAPITVTGGEFIFKTSTGRNRWYLNGATTFENLTITAEVESSGAIIVAQFNPIVMGEGLTLPTKTYLLGGHQLDNMRTNTEALMAEKGWPLDKDSHITIKSGTYHVVTGFSRAVSDAVYTGTSHIDVYGGTINMLLGGPCNGSTGNNAEINIYGGEITRLYTAGDGPIRLNGNCVVNLFDGKIATFDICNIMGVGTVNVHGGSIGQAAKRVEADAEFMVDGTVTLNIFEGATVPADVASGFDVVNGEVAPSVLPNAEEVKKNRIADALYSLGLVKGYDDSGSDFRLDNKLSRVEATVQIIRFLGAEEIALNAKYDVRPNQFTDVPSWAIPYVDYASSRGIISGRSDKIFDPDGTVDEVQFLTLLLRAMDYSDKDGDFVWSNPYELANKVGLIDYTEGLEVFSRGDAFVACYNSLTSKCKGGETVAEKLIIGDDVTGSVFTEEAYNNAVRIANGETN